MRFTKKLLAIFLSFAILISNFQIIGNVYAENTDLNLGQITKLNLDTRGVSTLVLTWKKVQGASGYDIYRLDTKSDKYVYRGTTNTNTYKDKELKSATNYYYKVKPYKVVKGKKKYGDYSNKLKATTKPCTPKVNLESDLNTSFIVTWTNTSSRNSGYKVYMSTSKNGKYNLIGNTGDKSFKVDNLEKNKTYYVKVRAYRTVDGKNIYGSYSDIKSIKLKGPKTTVSGLSTSLSKTAGLSLKDTIEISPAYGRKVYLQRYDSEKKTWVTKVTYTAPETKTGSVKLVYPSEWYNQISSKWRVYIPATDKGNSYTSSTINIKAKRVYENPKGYIQLKEKINVSGGGKDLVRGTMGLRVAKVQRRLGMGHVWEIVGPTTISRVMAFQRANGLKATGVVNLATWRKMGFSESSWYTLDTYVTPVKTKLTDTKEDLIEKMISTAKSYLGTEYVVGAAGVPGSGIDCSGLVMQAMYSVGIDPSPISVTRHTQPGYEYESRNLWKLPTLKTVTKPKRGDLVFYKNSSGTIIHVAIYLGNDKVIESWPEEVVEWPLIHPERPLIKGYKRIFG